MLNQKTMFIVWELRIVKAVRGFMSRQNVKRTWFWVSHHNEDYSVSGAAGVYGIIYDRRYDVLFTTGVPGEGEQGYVCQKVFRQIIPLTHRHLYMTLTASRAFSSPRAYVMLLLYIMRSNISNRGDKGWVMMALLILILIHYAIMGLFSFSEWVPQCVGASIGKCYWYQMTDFSFSQIYLVMM